MTRAVTGELLVEQFAWSWNGPGWCIWSRQLAPDTGYPWQRDSTWFHKESGAIFSCRMVICFDATLPDSRFPHTWQLTLNTTPIRASLIRLLAMMHLSTPINLSWNHHVPGRLDSEWRWVCHCLIPHSAFGCVRCFLDISMKSLRLRWRWGPPGHYQPTVPGVGQQA